MKLPFEEKFGQLAASPQRFDSLRPLAIHVLLLTEAALRFFPGSGVPLALWRPLGTAGPAGVGAQGPPRTSPAPARPSRRGCCASRGRASPGPRDGLAWPGLCVHPRTPAVSCAAAAPRAALTPAAPCPPPALRPGLSRCFIPL